MKSMLAKTMRQVVLVGAWLFIVTSIVEISWTAIALARSDSTGTVYLFFSATVDQRPTGGPGLTYHAWPGFLLAITEVAVIAVSLISTCRHNVVARRLGHIGLIAWASVPVCGAIWLYSLGASYLLFSAAIMAACWACVLLRAIWGWTPQRRAGGLSPGAEETSPVTPA